MKGTFYDVFVGGSSVEECGTMIKNLAQSGVSTSFAPRLYQQAGI